MLRSSEPFSQCERSHSRRPALSPALRRDGMKRCECGESPCVCPAGGEGQRGRGPVRKATNKKKKQKKNARKINKQKQSSLFISVLRARLLRVCWVPFQPERERPAAEGFLSVRAESRWERERQNLKPGTGFLDHTDTESARKWSHKHITVSTTQAKAVVEDDYAELRRNAKQIICFVYTTFWPLSIGFALRAPHRERFLSCCGQAGLFSQWLCVFSHCNSSLHQKEKVQIFVFFPSTWPQSESDCGHAATGAVIHRTKGHTCHFHQRAYHYFICWPSSQSVTLKCNAHPRTVKEWVEKAMEGSMQLDHIPPYTWL